MSFTINAYRAPVWFRQHPLIQKQSANVLANKLPEWRFNFLSQTPTRIERFCLPSRLDQTAVHVKTGKKFEVYVKRDDLTSDQLALQGNKLRKMEFIMAQAVQKCKAEHVLTAGGIQSNHCRTVSALAARLGIKAHLFLRADRTELSDSDLNGNLLLNALYGANVYLIEKNAQYLESIRYKMEILAEKLKEKSFLIPIGGSNLIGLFGYIEAFNEMLYTQHIDEFFDDIVVTTGSGGTMAALAIANFMTGSRVGLHAFAVCDSSAYFYRHLDEQLDELFGKDTDAKPNARQLVNIISCSKGLGYAKSTPQELLFIAECLRNRSSPLLLDPVYTGKTFYSLINLLADNEAAQLYYQTDKAAKEFKSKLRGNRVLFVHTGGQLGCFDNAKFSQFLLKPTQSQVSTSSLPAFKWFNCFNENIDKIKI